MNFLDASRKFIELDSTPTHGNHELALFAARLCQEAGLAVELEEENFNGLPQANVIARIGATEPSPEELMLQTRLDTGEPGGFTLWTKTQANPFNASIYQNEIFGLGTADCKLDYLCKLEALKSLSGQKLRSPAVLVGTFGAHQGMAGAVRLMRRKKVLAKRALIGEPTGLKLANAGQGLAVVEISVPFSEEEIRYRDDHDLLESGSTQSKIFNGKQTSVAIAELSDNAIVRMLDYLTQLPEGIAIMDLDGGVNFSSPPSSAVLEIDVVGVLRDPILPRLSMIMSGLRRLDERLKSFYAQGWNPPHPTINIGMVRTFPDQVRLIGSCRLPPEVTDRHYTQWMTEMREQCDRAGARYRVRDYKPGFHSAENSDFVGLCQKTLAEQSGAHELTRVVASTEANVFSRMGIECLAFGPGLGLGNSQFPNEHVKIEDLSRATEFYKSILERVCL